MELTHILRVLLISAEKGVSLGVVPNTHLKVNGLPLGAEQEHFQCKIPALLRFVCSYGG